jgi:hypothetical protein
MEALDHDSRCRAAVPDLVLHDEPCRKQWHRWGSLR